LWNDCCQEEIRRGRDVDEDEDEENLALTSKRGARGRKIPFSRGAQVVGQRRISYMFSVMCVVNLSIMPTNALKPRRAKEQKAKRRK
jgi:hypothetical protein